MNVEVLLKKEEMNERNVKESTVVVVFDILLATSTIVTCLAANAKAIYPVINKMEAIAIEGSLIGTGVSEKDILLAGEINAMMVEGFLHPTPIFLSKYIQNKHLILLTTNGTLAIKRAANAKTIFITSLLNSAAVARKIINDYESADVNVICSGSNGKFCLEDFYGAGYFINQLTTFHHRTVLSDSALTAKLFYKSYMDKSREILFQSSVGNILQKIGLQADIDFVSQKDLYQITPIFSKNKIV